MIGYDVIWYDMMLQKLCGSKRGCEGGKSRLENIA
jgi:hypothetical protein